MDRLAGSRRFDWVSRTGSRRFDWVLTFKCIRKPYGRQKWPFHKDGIVLLKYYSLIMSKMSILFLQKRPAPTTTKRTAVSNGSKWGQIIISLKYIYRKSLWKETWKYIKWQCNMYWRAQVWERVYFHMWFRLPNIWSRYNNLSISWFKQHSFMVKPITYMWRYIYLKRSLYWIFNSQNVFHHLAIQGSLQCPTSQVYCILIDSLKFELYFHI